jgi:hypothetical protein
LAVESPTLTVNTAFCDPSAGGGAAGKLPGDNPTAHVDDRGAKLTTSGC